MSTKWTPAQIPSQKVTGMIYDFNVGSGAAR